MLNYLIVIRINREGKGRLFDDNNELFMNSQEIKSIRIEDLVLWTENPRDPISPDSNDQDVANKAFEDNDGRWNLKKLISDMGEYYDFSELPIVVYNMGKPIVYDGNRRILLGKIKKGLISLPSDYELDIKKIADFPDELPCNVCSQEIALKSVCRKHSEIGSWDVLGRDHFMHKYMHEPKSALLVIDEFTGLISANPNLNKRFVKDEVLTDSVLEQIGFKIEGEVLKSRLTNEGQKRVLEDLKEKINNKTISTRKNRYSVFDALDETSKRLIDNCKENPFVDVKSSGAIVPSVVATKAPRKTKRTQNKDSLLFGAVVELRIGNVNDLYRDILSIAEYYLANKEKLSNKFPALLRMSLRLLVETAACEDKKSIDKYIETYFDKGKALLSKDEKTSLSNNNVTKMSLSQLLNTGAHNYSDSLSYDKAYAMSLIVGKMLSISHPRR